MVWGTGQDYELGNGKRSSLATPTTLTQTDATRCMVMKIKADVWDLQGNVWRRKAEVLLEVMGIRSFTGKSTDSRAHQGL